MNGDIINAVLVKCDHCNDWFEPKIFTIRDITSLLESKMTLALHFEEQYVICGYCKERTFASHEKTKPI